MNMPLVRWTAMALVMALLAVLSAGCVTTDEGYGYTEYGASVGLDYYEPYGEAYGGWGDGFFVAPFRDGGHRQEHRDHPRRHAYRNPPSGSTVPSIPWRPRHRDDDRR